MTSPLSSIISEYPSQWAPPCTAVSHTELHPTTTHNQEQNPIPLKLQTSNSCTQTSNACTSLADISPTKNSRSEFPKRIFNAAIQGVNGADLFDSNLVSVESSGIVSSNHFPGSVGKIDSGDGTNMEERYFVDRGDDPNSSVFQPQIRCLLPSDDYHNGLSEEPLGCFPESVEEYIVARRVTDSSRRSNVKDTRKTTQKNAIPKTFHDAQELDSEAVTIPKPQNHETISEYPGSDGQPLSSYCRRCNYRTE